MSTSNTLQERLAEARAAAACEQVVRILNETIIDPSSKRFAHSRPARIERWLQLEKVAKEQANGLMALSKATPRKTKATKPLAPAFTDSAASVAAEASA